MTEDNNERVSGIYRVRSGQSEISVDYPSQHF